MDFINMLKNNYMNVVFKNYTNFSGRANRPEYWWFFLANIIISIVFGIVDGILASVLGFAILGTIYSLAVLLPSIAVTIRRLHDTNRSGWWLLISLIPLVGTLVLIWFLVQKGDNKKNQFGELAK